MALKLNFLLFVSIQQQKPWQIINLILINLLKEFYTELITGLMKDLAGLLNQLHVELTSPKKGLINIKNKDQTCFLWCQIRHINPAKVHSKRIVQKHKKLVNDLYYEGTELSV